MKRFSGFTLIEVIVVIGIMAVMSAIVLANFPRFQRGAVVEREVAKLALAMRKAQSYSLGVREFNPAPAFNDDPFCVKIPVRFPGYGVYLAMSSPTVYTIFGDATCSKKYDTFPVDETVENITIENKAKLASLKGFNVGICSSGCALDEVLVFYLRPGPSIFLTDADGINSYDYFEISLASSDGSVAKTAVVRSTGQISIK